MLLRDENVSAKPWYFNKLTHRPFIGSRTLQQQKTKNNVLNEKYCHGVTLNCKDEMRFVVWRFRLSLQGNEKEIRRAFMVSFLSANVIWLSDVID